MLWPHGTRSLHHSSKEGELLFRAPFLQLLLGENRPHFDQIFDVLLLQLGLEFNDLGVFSVDGFHVDGGGSEKFSELQTFREELGSKKLSLPEVSLLDQF